MFLFRFFKQLTALLAVLLLLVPGEATRAQAQRDPSFAPTCYAAGSLATTFEDIATRRAHYCNSSEIRADQPVAWLVFDAQSWSAAERPRYFYSRITRFETITFAALDADGTLRKRGYSEFDARAIPSGPVFQMTLPEVTAETRAVIVRIERPHSVPLLSEARLTAGAERGAWTASQLMVLALVLGMLVLPLLFDVTFYVVLRERYVLLHAAMVISMMAYVLFSGGLIHVFVTLPHALVAIAGPLIWAIGCGVSAFFFAEFVERDAQTPAMRKATIALGWWLILVPGFMALQFHATQSFDDRFYFYAFIPALVFLPFAIVDAIRRGSRAARFIALAWTPMLIASTERLARGLGFYTAPSTLDQSLYVAAAIEVIIISLAIGERLLMIRRERDAALTDAEKLEQLSVRDPLTGLINRRAIEARFEDLRAQGFNTFAVIDLDHFKQINDRYGHQVGDRALIACAGALSIKGERDTIAIRLGGEEFVVLLRGPRPVERAETLRQSIPHRVADEVSSIDQPVTASMGVIELPRETQHMMSFDDLYARADKLLYDAKASGRNRMLFEKLTVFHVPPTGRPRLNAAA
ncbi:MAG: diguanylate cyclase [Erythrobacter sp.]